LAYQVQGSGPIDVVEVGGYGVFAFSIESTQDQPRWRRFEETLSGFCRLIRFDQRGVGLSDPLTGQPVTEQLVADVVAVIDDAGADRVSVLASGFGGPIGIGFAAWHPGRVHRLVLVNSLARTVYAPDYTFAMRAEDYEAMAAGTDPDLADGSDIDTLAPTIAKDPDVRRWWDRESRRGASPTTAGWYWRWFEGVDVRSVVAEVVAPALVITTGVMGNQAHSEWLVEHLGDARLITVDGGDLMLWAMPDTTAVEEIEEFLTGGRAHSVGHGVLTTVMFTDIVESTARNTQEGDRGWLDRLARHDDMVSRQIRRFGGTQIKHTGDGILATFTAPTLALQAAHTIADEAAELDIEIRAAVHVVEVQEHDNDIFGLGVAITARILAHAEGGEIVTTSAVREILTGSEFRFHARGTHTLKGVPEHWALYSVTTTPTRTSGQN
jgi:class 3 adenylate cyclase